MHALQTFIKRIFNHVIIETPTTIIHPNEERQIPYLNAPEGSQKHLSGVRNEAKTVLRGP